MVALYWIAALLFNAAPGGALETEIARIVKTFQPVQTDCRLGARIIATAECALLAVVILVAEDLVSLLPLPLSRLDNVINRVPGRCRTKWLWFKS